MKTIKTDEYSLKRILEAEKLVSEIEQVLRLNKDCKLYAKQIAFNKKYNLPLGSVVGMLLVIGKETEI